MRLFFLSAYSSSSSTQYPDTNGPPCVTCYDVYINYQPFSDYQCNPNGQRKFQAGFVNLKIVNSDGYCVNFEAVNYDALSTDFVWVYATDGNIAYDYYGKPTSVPSIPLSSSNAQDSNFWLIFREGMQIK